MKNRRMTIVSLLLAAFIAIAGCGGGGSAGGEDSEMPYIGVGGKGKGNGYGNIGAVTGTVTDADGTYLAGVQVQVGGKSAVTGVSGKYTITEVTKGPSPISAYKEGYRKYFGTCIILKGATITHNIQMTSLYSPADLTPPDAVTGLVTSVASASQIDLAWNASTDNVGVTGYTISRDGIDIGTASTPTYSDTGLTPGTDYCYAVAAFDAAGNVSPMSVQSCATTLAAPSTPPSTSVTLAWDAPLTNEDGSPLTDLAGYRLYYGTSPGQYTDFVDVGKIQQYTFENLSSGSYYFAATAYDSMGKESLYSTEVSTTLPF